MLRYTWITFAVIVLDQLTKLAAENLLTLYSPVAVIPGFNFTLVYNTGAAFSFLSDAGGWQKWFFILLAFGVSIGIIIWLKIQKDDNRSRWMAIALCLIMGGALGNAIDRLVYDHVIDFLDFYYSRYHWPAFNVADIAISVGAGLLIIQELFFLRKQNSEHEHSEHDKP
jgi:signal peptidase II